MNSNFKKIVTLILSVVIALSSSAALAAGETPADYIIDNGNLYEMGVYNSGNWYLFCSAGNSGSAEVKDDGGNHLYYRYTPSTDVYHSGNSSMWFDIEHLNQNGGTSGDNIFGAVLWSRTENPFKHGKTYTISYWVKNETGAELTVFPKHQYYGYADAADTSYVYSVLYYDGHSSTGQNCKKTISADENWQYVTHTFTANAEVYKENMCGETKYYIVLSSTNGDVADGKGIYIDQLRFMEVPSDDLFPSSFTSVNPENNAQGIAVESPVTFSFNGLVSADSISASDVYFNGDNTNPVTITGTVDLESCTSTVTVTPTLPLAANTAYTVEVKNLKDIFGRAYTAEEPVAMFTTMPDITFEYEFTDENGDEVTSIQTGEINCTYTATTHTDKITDAVLVMALCKGNTIEKFDLVAMNDFVKFTPKSETATIDVALASGESLSDYHIRCFVLDGIGTFRTVDNIIVELD